MWLLLASTIYYIWLSYRSGLQVCRAAREETLFSRRENTEHWVLCEPPDKAGAVRRPGGGRTPEQEHSSRLQGWSSLRLASELILAACTKHNNKRGLKIIIIINRLIKVFYIFQIQHWGLSDRETQVVQKQLCKVTGKILKWFRLLKKKKLYGKAFFYCQYFYRT